MAATAVRGHGNWASPRFYDAYLSPAAVHNSLHCVLRDDRPLGRGDEAQRAFQHPLGFAVIYRPTRARRALSFGQKKTRQEPGQNRD